MLVSNFLALSPTEKLVLVSVTTVFRLEAVAHVAGFSFLFSEVLAEESSMSQKALNHLREIWELIGIPEDQRLQRTEVVKHIKVSLAALASLQWDRGKDVGVSSKIAYRSDARMSQAPPSLFACLFWPNHGDPSSQTKVEPGSSAPGVWSLNHWT